MKRRQLRTRGIHLLAMLLALAMVVGLLPISAFAARIDDEALPLEAPADDTPSDLAAATPANVLDAAKLLETTADATAAGNVVGTEYSDDPNAYEIYPVPHSVVYPSDHSSFTMTDAVNVVVGAGVDEYTVNFVKEILTKFSRTVTETEDSSKTTIRLAVHGDSDTVAPTSVTDLWTAADKFDAYLLKAEDGTITIIGEDADAVYYGVATLQMMFTSFNGGKFLNVQIEDYSNTVFRGFIEGFYGGFSYEQRESQMRGIRDVKGNMYVFASKTDPYHGAQWADLYPTTPEAGQTAADLEINKIKHLVDVGKEVKVNYTWSVHIGKGGVLNGVDNGAEDGATDFVYVDTYNDRLDKMKAKFQQLYDIGVRSFNVLNDDYNSGTNRVQVKFLNDLNKWLKEKGCMPLIYCCAGYNTAWAQGGYGNHGEEIVALAGLDDDIYLYWTGADVNSPIDQTNTSWAFDRSGQPIVTWINYPCSEHCGKRGVFLGDISHYVKNANNLTHHYGILANPMDWAEANKVAYFQLLSWAWNRDNYTSYLTELWLDSFKYLQPEVAGAYRTIARNVANAPDSGRVPAGAFPESEYIKDALEAVQAAALAGEALPEPQTQTLLTELDNILSAVDAFRKGCDNVALKTELETWLSSLECVTTAAKNAIQAVQAMRGDAADKSSAIWSHFSTGGVALSKWNTFSHLDNGNASRVSLSGSLRLQPFAEAVLNYVKTNLNAEYSPNGLGGDVLPMVMLGGTIQTNNDNARKMLDGNPSSYASFQTVQKAGDYVGVNLGQVELVEAIDILQGQNDTHHDYLHQAVLEYSADGKDWTPLVTKVNSHHIHVDGLNIAARYVRLRLLAQGYGGKDDYWTYVREFTVTTKENSPVYTSLNSVPDGLTVAEDGGVYTLTVPSLPLPAQGYVGIRLPEIAGIQTIATQGTLPSDVKVQYSLSGTVWNDLPLAETTRMGYVRLYNAGTGDAALPGITLTASAPVRTHLTFVSSNVGIYNGQQWTNAVDGNRASFAYTNTKQTQGQHAIFDLGGLQPVEDVCIYIPDTTVNDVPHNLDIKIATSLDGEWTRIGGWEDDGYSIAEPQPYQFYQCDGGKQAARYIKLEISKTASNWFKINELEVNTAVEQEEPLTAVGSTSGNASDADDGDLLSFFNPTADKAGQWEKYFQDATRFDSVTVLRGASGSSAKVYLRGTDGLWAGTPAGTLSETATTIELDQAITGVRITWDANDAPSIAEVIMGGGTTIADQPPAQRLNIYEKPADPAGVTVANGTALAAVGLPASVQATMSDGTTVRAGVTWSCADYVATTAGNYTFTGTLSNDYFNPGCFTLSATVIVEPPAQGETSNLALNRNAYASGREAGGNGPSQAVNGTSSGDSRWVGNYMKSIATNPSWIVVDLGNDVASISSIVMDYHVKVWPVSYKIQVAGNGFTPVDYCDENGAGGGAMNADTFAGDNAEDAACWTTLKTATGLSGLTDSPTITVDSFDTALPAGSRYLRIYYKEMNSAAAGHAISLRELTVNGTLLPAPTGVTVSSATGGTAASLVTNGTKTVQLSASVAPATANQGVTWRSNDPNVATVDANGLVTAVGDGSTTIVATALGGNASVSGGYQVNVRTAVTGVTVTKTDDTALTDNTVRVYTNTNLAGHDHSITLKGTVTPSNATNKALNWTRTDGAQGLISVEREGTGASAVITAVTGETNVGEVNVEVASDSDPTVKTSFKVQVFRALEHNVTISGNAKCGSTLTADTNQLVMTQAGKDALTYQWKRDGVDISGNAAKAKTYTLTQDDIGAIISVEVTASEATFYEGTKTAALTKAVDLADGPAAPDGLLGVQCTSSANNDGKITGFPGTGDNIYEYKLRDDPDEAASWTAVAANATEVTGLPAGSYQVRIKATATQKAGAIRNVTVGAYNATLYPVTVGSHTNGALTRDPAQAEEGATVTLTVTPDPGYALVENGLSVVKTASGDPIDYNAAGDNTYTFTMPAEAVTVSATFELTKVHITHALTDLTCTMSHEGEDVHTVDWGSVQTITLTAAEGYDLPTTITITKSGGAAFTAYTYNNGVITFNGGGLTEDVTITAAGVKKTYQVAYTMTHGLTAPEANAPRTVKHKEAYTGKLVAGDAAYTLPLGIQVTMGGETFTDFTYDSATGMIDIAAGKITGNLVITAAGLDATLPIVLVTGVTLDQRTASLKVNGRVTLTPTVSPEEATEKGVVWSSSDDSVATVSAGGVVTAVAPGTATITVTTMDGGFTAPCVVTVTKASTSGGSTSSGSSTTETKEDGTKVTTVTKPDGTVTETTEAPDGTKAVVEAKPDGSKTQTVEQADGTKSEMEVTKEGDVTITVTDPEGEELVKTEIPAEIPEPESKFEDVDTTPWAEEAIHKMAGLELVNGTGGNKYSPVAPMTRGSLATVLHRLSQGKTDYENTFKDVAQGKYYSEGVAWAAKANVVKGISEDIFAPDDIITREQLAVMLARYAKLIGMDTKADSKALDQFADGDSTGDWAVDGMAWCVENGILRGKGQNNLDPTENVTRAEVAVMLDRFIGLIQK